MNEKKLNIPLSRLRIYLVLLLSLPFLLLGVHYFKKKKEWDACSDKILLLGALSETKTRKQSLNNFVKELHRDTDHFYLTTHLETLRFLKKEKEALETLMQNPTFTGNEAAEKRYAFITDGRNKLHFTETHAATEGHISEHEESLTHPVEIDASDLKELLFAIETHRPGKPLLVITDFRLTKKEQTWGNEVFELNLKLLKREFLQ